MNTDILLSKPKEIISLASSGVLAEVRVRVWTASKSDKSVADTAAATYGAQSNALRATHDLFVGDNDLKSIHNERQVFHNWLTRYAFVWNKSQHYVPTIWIQRFSSDFTAMQAGFYAKVDAFCADYAAKVSNAAFTRGSLYNPNDYPDVTEVRRRFRCDLTMSEVPVGDYRVQIADDLANDMFENLSRQANEAVRSIVGKQCKQLASVMDSLSHCCETVTKTNAKGETKTSKRKVYDTTLTRALELCESFQSFNLTENEDLEEARFALSKLLHGVTLETLRESDTLRQEVKEGVDDILSKFRPVVNAFDDDEEDNI
jgi:hypothetical protein